MKGKKRTALLALSLAGLLSLSAWSALAGYYIDASGNHIYIPDSSVSNGSYYLNGTYYSAYTGTINYNYNNNNYYNNSYYPYNYYWGISPVNYAYTQGTVDSLGGVTAPRATMVEARANNHYLGLNVVGMREDLMDTEAVSFGISATQLTFDQSLGRAADKSLTLIMRSAVSSVSDNDQYALGVYGTYNAYKKAVDEKLESLTLIDRNESFRVSIALKSFVEALEEPLAEAGAKLNKDGIQVQIRPVEAPSLGNYSANAGAYKISVFLYKYEDDQESRIDLSEHVNESLHAMIKATSPTKSVLVITGGSSLETAATPKWIQRTSGDCYAAGFVPAGSVFTAVPVKKS